MPTPISPQETTVAGILCRNQRPGKGPKHLSLL